MITFIRNHSFTKFLVFLICISILPLSSCTSSFSDEAEFFPASTGILTINGVHTASDFTGEEMFLGTFFTSNEFANLIPSLQGGYTTYNQLPETDREKFSERLAEMTELINSQEPNFFNEFKAGILSGDQNTIQRVMGRAGNHAYNNFSTVFPELTPVIEQIKEDIRSGEYPKEESEITDEFLLSKRDEYQSLLRENMLTTDTRACSLALVCAVVVALAVHNVVAASSAIAVAVSAYFTLALWGPGLASPRIQKKTSNPGDPLASEIFINEIAQLP
ncbi:MAG: hypothetical protein IPJ74_01885 [Saprospiraceae bacterium]|nr:hypothetical protein [Saprospiraceae bacterium]